MEINKEDIIRYWKFLGHKNQTEIRALKPKWFDGEKFPVSLFVKNARELTEAVEKLNGEYNIYVGINERKENCKEDADVEFITNIGHDIDAHGGGIDGLQIAGEVAINMLEICKELGYKEPMIINSGNGYWVIHHIKPILNTDENVKKIKEFGKRIGEKHKREGIIIDQAVYNPSRIARVPGTTNISNKDNQVMSFLINNPPGEEDEKLAEDILALEIPTYKPQTSISKPGVTPSGIGLFMDWCLTHQIPEGERNKTINKNLAMYLVGHPQREILREQYLKMQPNMNPGDLDGWIKKVEEEPGKYVYNIGELVNFTKKYKIPFPWNTTPEYQQWTKEKKADVNIQKEILKEQKAEQFNKAIKFFIDKKHLAEQFIEVQPLFYDNSKLWWLWNPEIKCWELCDEVDIMNYISDHSEADTISSKEKNEILEALKQVSRRNRPKKIPETWIQFKDYIVDIITDEKIEVNHKHFVTNPIPWEIGISGDTPVMDKIFKEWVGEEHVKTLYEIIAYCLLNGYPIHRIFCFIGAGLNGKSKFLELLRKFIGEYNCCSTELDTLISSRFEVTRLHKKLVCQMGETNFGELNKTSLLKKLSGGDLIGFEYKNKDPFEEINKAKIIISTNNLPATSDKTLGFYRRWMIIDFPNTFSEKKDILEDIPEIEYNNLCFKSISLLKDLLIKREFTNEGTIEQRMQKYEARSNFLEQFLKEFTKEDFEGYITKSDFYKKFTSWCKENRHREMSETSVGMAMKKLSIHENKKYFDWLYDGRGGQARIWDGIAWK